MNWYGIIPVLILGVVVSGCLGSDVISAGSGSGTDNTKVNKTGDNISGGLNDINQDWNILPYSISGSNGITGGYNTVDVKSAGNSPWNTSYKFFSNNVYFQKPCLGDDNYGGAVGYCWVWGKYNNITADQRDGMTFQLENGQFTYYFWKAGMNNTNTYGTDDESAGYTRRMTFDKNLTIFNGTMNLNKNGAGITMHSPNGNAWCTTVTNAGTLSTSAGAC